jgi:hypothetical protein
MVQAIESPGSRFAPARFEAVAAFIRAPPFLRMSGAVILLPPFSTVQGPPPGRLLSPPS